MSNLKDEIKTALRIKTNDSAIDIEIGNLIGACIQDMILAGVDEDLARYSYDPLVAQAQKFYAKAYFGNGDESGRFQRAYEALRDRLAIGGKFNG